MHSKLSQRAPGQSAFDINVNDANKIAKNFNNNTRREFLSGGEKEACIKFGNRRLKSRRRQNEK
jgi:hypothetical protein